MIRGRCEFCDGPVLSSEVAAFPVTGWEPERAQGGANRIIGRQRVPDRIAHVLCAEHHAKLGAQEALPLS